MNVMVGNERVLVVAQQTLSQAPSMGLLLALMATTAAICAALLYIRMGGRYAQGERILGADADLAPGVLRGYALALVDAQRFAEAEQATSAHLARVPADVRLRGVLAALFSLRGEHALAVAELRRSVQMLRHDGEQLQPHMASYVALLLVAQAVELEQVGNAAEANASMREALALDPQAANLRSGCMRIVVEAARDSELERTLFEGMGEWDGTPAPTRPLGFPDALGGVRFFKRALAAHPNDARLLGDYAQALQASGNMQEAEHTLRQALQVAPRDAWLHFDLGCYHWRLDRFADAQRELAEAAQLAPRQAAIRSMFGLLLQRMGQMQDAERELIAAVNARPDVWTIMRLLGRFMTEQNRLPQALRAFQEAERLGASDTDFRLDYAAVLARVDQAKNADEQYRLAIRADQRNGVAHARYAAFLLDEARLREAEKQARNALPWSGGEAAHLTLASLCLLERRLDEAMTHLKAAQENDVRSPQVQECQAEWLLLRGRAPEVVTLAQRLVEEGRPSGMVYLALGGALLALDRKIEAQAALREAVRVDPALPATLLRRARALRELGFLAAAQETLNQTLTLAPNWPDALAEQQQVAQEFAALSAPESGRRGMAQRPRA